MQGTQTRIALVEDEADHRVEFQRLVNGTDDLKFIGAFKCAESLLKALTSDPVGVGGPPSLLVLDLNLASRCGEDLIPDVLRAWPDCRVAAWTVVEDPERILRAIQNGANGYLLKSDPPERIVDSIRVISQGGAFMSAQIARQIVKLLREGTSKQPRIQLSKRHMEIVTLLSKGHLYKEIADELGISIHTVREHISRIYDMLGVSGRTAAVNKVLGEQRGAIHMG